MAIQSLEKIQKFLTELEQYESEQMMILVEKHLSDEGIEIFVDHIQQFYGIEDEEEAGMLAQIMVTGYLSAKAELGLIEGQAKIQ